MKMWHPLDLAQPRLVYRLGDGTRRDLAALDSLRNAQCIDISGLLFPLLLNGIGTYLFVVLA